MIHGPNVILRPVREADYLTLFLLESRDLAGPAWRFAGLSVDPASYRERFWAGVLEAWVLMLADGTDQPVGLVLAYDVDLRDRSAYLALMVRPDQHDTGIGIVALALLVRRLFDTWGLRVLYADCLPESFARLASGAGRYFEVVGSRQDGRLGPDGPRTRILLRLTARDWEMEIQPIVQAWVGGQLPDVVA